MRNFDADIITALTAETARAFWLVELQLASTYRFTNCDIDLTSAGKSYDCSYPLQIKDIRQSADFSIDRITLEFANVDLGLSAILLAEDVANLPAIIRYVMLDSDYQEIDAPEFFRGFITAWQLREPRAVLTLGNEFMLWRKKTLRLPTASCPWVFSGSECAYAGGSTWCDQSVERCKGLANYDNFGGRRYIQAVEDKKIYWTNK
jgi:phage-related protein